MMFFQAMPNWSGKRIQDMPLKFLGIVEGDATTPPTSPQTFASVWDLTGKAGDQMQIVSYTLVPDDNMPGQRDRSAAVAIVA